MCKCLTFLLRDLCYFGFEKSEKEFKCFIFLHLHILKLLSTYSNLMYLVNYYLLTLVYRNLFKSLITKAQAIFNIEIFFFISLSVKTFKKKQTKIDVH